MQHLIQTHYILAAILSRHTSEEDWTSRLHPDASIWDSLVMLSSQHFVLPAMHHQLQVKGLQHRMPKTLEAYLTEISQMNRERNEALVRQIHSLSSLLKQHQIPHVFLKGAALLVSGIFEDLSERMLGDIDLIIATEHLDTAYALLLEEGYQESPTSFGVNFFEHKHLPRLLPSEDTGIGAVELHSKLFQHHSHDALSASELISKRQDVNGVSIPSWEQLFLHHILNWQYNDYGYLTHRLNFRAAYDTISLLEAHPILYKGEWSQHPAIKRYLNLLGEFFEEVKPLQSKSKKRAVWLYRYKLKHPKFSVYYNRIMRYVGRFPLLWERFKMFVRNKHYRQLLWQDRKRVWRLLMKL